MSSNDYPGVDSASARRWTEDKPRNVTPALPYAGFDRLTDDGEGVPQEGRVVKGSYWPMLRGALLLMFLIVITLCLFLPNFD